MSDAPVRDHCEMCGGLAPCDCVERLARFTFRMRQEMTANAAKGGRNGWEGWLSAGPAVMLNEVHDHVAKLHVAVRELIRRQEGRPPRPTPWGDNMEERVLEFAADAGILLMMLTDTLGLIDNGGSA